MFGKNEIPKSINFLEPVTRPSDIWAHAYQWLFEVGKYMLIVVQVVALGVFIARFVVDEQNNDLTKEINDQVTLLSGGSWKQDSLTYENIQNLLGDVDRIEKGQKRNSVIIEEIRNSIPYGLNVESFSFSNGRVSLTLQTTDFKAFKDYETALKSNPSYENVSVNTTKNESVFDIRISFVLTGTDA